MSSEAEGPLDSQDQALEAALARLRPSAVGIDRDALFFEAGRQAGLRAGTTRRWIWTSSAAALGGMAAAFVFMALLIPSPDSQVVQQVVSPAGVATTQAEPGPAADAILPPEAERTFERSAWMVDAMNWAAVENPASQRSAMIASLLEEFSSSPLYGPAAERSRHSELADASLDMSDMPARRGPQTNRQLRDQLLKELVPANRLDRSLNVSAPPIL